MLKPALNRRNALINGRVWIGEEINRLLLWLLGLHPLLELSFVTPFGLLKLARQPGFQLLALFPQPP